MRYVLSNLGQGLRRNLSMHVAVIITLFVSLTLVGLGVLLNQQADKAAAHWGSQLQITVWLCKDKDDNASCNGEVTEAQKAAIIDVVEANPEVAGYHTESKEEAFEKVKELLGPERFEGPNPAATAEAMPQSLWIELEDPEQFEGVTSAVIGLDGVSGIRDMREVLEPIYGSINALEVGRPRHGGLPGPRRAAAGRQHDPAGRARAAARDRHHATGRRLDALHRAALPPGGPGDRAASASCSRPARSGAFMYYGIYERAGDQLKFMPWIGMEEYTVAVIAIAILGPLLTVLPTLVLTRKYLKV